MDLRQLAQAATVVVRPFMSRGQMIVTQTASQGGEGAFFLQALIDLAKTIETMPSTHENRYGGQDDTAHLHYFYHGSDWYITEKDVAGGVDQAYGYAILNGDMQNAEFGYISISELVEHGVELDFHFKSSTVAQILAKFHS